MNNDLQIGINSCLHKELSLIKLKDNKYTFPKYFYEDYYIDYFEEFNIDIQIKDNLVLVDINDIDYDTLFMLRTRAYSANIWYSELEKFTIPSKLISIENLKDAIYKITKFPVFVKLDTVSAKDTGHNGVFNSCEEIINIFSKSDRIQSTLNDDISEYKHNHSLFVREVDTNIISNKGVECRCFVYHSKLTAISCSKYIKNIKENIIQFFNKILPYLPYNDAVVDIYVSDKIKIIELNTFGADGPCGAGMYNWKDDYLIIHSVGNDVDFRCKSEFSY